MNPNVVDDLITGLSLVFLMLACPIGVLIGTVVAIRDKSVGGWIHALAGIILAVALVWLLVGVAVIGFYERT